MLERSISLPTAISNTHRHLLTVINSEISSMPEKPVLRVLDVGCGDGRLLSYLAACLPRLNPLLQFEFYGLDVDDSGVQRDGFFAATIDRLQNDHPAIDWSNRLSLASINEDWPYAADDMDIIVSNQVLEHVANHPHFMSEVRRTLTSGGVAVHLFPLIHYIWEGHLDIPLVHRIRQYSALKSYIRFCSKLGLGKFRQHKSRGVSLEQYVERHADYMVFMTNYLSEKALFQICKKAGLKADLGYTGRYYTSKLRSMMGLPAQRTYVQASPLRAWIELKTCKRISSITLCLKKGNSYSHC